MVICTTGLDDKDKALVTEVVYGTIKYKYSIDKILQYYLRGNFNKIDSFVLNILRSAIYQMRFLLCGQGHL
jgi:16S rRNA (cytosine967-C5)-methyltransferase